MDAVPPPPPGAPDSPSAETSSTGLERNVAAGLACLFTVVSGAVFLVIERKDAFVRFWAMQAVLLGGLALGFQVIIKIVGALFGFIPVIGNLMAVVFWLGNLVFGVAWFVAYLISVVKAFCGEEWEMPILGPIARRQLARLSPPVPPAPGA